MNSNISYIFDDEVYNSVKKLNYYLKKSNYYKPIDKSYKNRDTGMKILGEIGDSKIQYKYVPNRIQSSITKKKEKGICPLCISIQENKLIYPVNKVKGILWRDYLIVPNTFPYFKNHLLIISLDHNHGKMGIRGTQLILHQNINIIYDFTNLIVFLKKGTLFFNGLIGNSQMHFHFQYTTENLPIVNYLSKQSVKKEVLITENGIKIYLFKISKSKCLNGILLKGDESIYKDIFKIIKYISKRYLYNIILYNKNKQIMCLIFIRKKLIDSNINDFKLGASSLGGIHSFLEKDYFFDTKIANDITEYCNLTVIPIKIKLIKEIFL
jgi:hypothetical protein